MKATISSRIVFLLLTAFTSASSWAAEGGPHEANTGNAVGRQGQAAKGGEASPEMLAVHERIARMKDIVDGKIPAPVRTANDPEELFLRPRSEIVEELTKKLLAGLDNGRLESILAHDLLTDGEAYAGQEPKEVFEVNGVDLYEKLKSEEKTDAAVAYTQARKELRKRLLEDLAKRLQKETDPRAILAAEAVLKTLSASQDSYDRAIKTIQKHGKTRPICFTCGETVDEEDTDYEFSSAMGTAAEKAVKTMKLDNLESKGVVKSPYLDPSRKFYSFDGKQIHEIKHHTDGSGGLTDVSVDTHEISRSAEGTIQYRAPGAPQPTNLNPADPRQKAMSDLRLEMLNSGGKRQVLAGSAAPAQPAANGLSARSIPATTTTSPQPAATSSVPNALKDYLQAVRGGSSPAAQAITADVLATKLGLVDGSGSSLLIHKNDHWPKDGSGQLTSMEFGVTVDWARIRKLDEATQNQVMATLLAVKRGSISDFKVVNGNQGHCLWCNLNNQSESKQYLSAWESSGKLSP